MAFAVRAPVDCEPLVVRPPDQSPEALQVTAFVLDQLNFDAFPLVIELGLGVRLTVGAGVDDVTETVAACVALPPAPVHVNE